MNASYEELLTEIRLLRYCCNYPEASGEEMPRLSCGSPRRLENRFVGPHHF